MNGGKEEKMKPLFPRLHVNDADKGGGPRAPPRNKMALYEQLCVPSKRINYTGVGPSLLHLPQHACGNPAASASTSQGGGQERGMFSPFYIHQPPSQSAEMVQSCPSIANSLNSAGTELMRRSVRHANPSSSSALGLANVKSSHEKNLDKDDIIISTFVRSDTAHSGKDKFMMETKRSTPLQASSVHKSHSATPNTSIQFQSSHDKPLKRKDTSRRSRIYERNTSESKCKVIIKEQKEKDVNNLGSSSVQGHTSQRETIEKSHKKNTRVGLVSNGSVPEPEPEYLNANAENEDASLELNDGDKNDVSESSMLDSISDLGISPDDVVGVIGQKQFWKTRRAIVNQQRVFAIQVFELHRLIKVQKLLAASPYLLLEENLYASESRQKVPGENTLTESIEKPDPQITKLNDDSQKPNENTESQSEETIPVPLPSHGDGPHLLPYPGNPASSTLVPVAPGNNPTPWCHPQANHWLIPVMSPSEGLIYKPYAGPWPPPASFMPPIYRNCGPLNLRAVDADNIITPHQQNMSLPSGASIPPTNFPSPSGLPANASATTVAQVRPSTGPIPRPHIGQRSRSSSKMDINEARPNASATTVAQVRTSRGPIPRPHIGRWSRSSSNMDINEACPKAPSSKDELQGSTASSPFKKAQTLPLFPTAPTVEGSGHASESRVIKVVPHNSRSATESVARIFRSIQKERQHYESHS